MDILEKLYYGDVAPCERKISREDPCTEVGRQITKLETELNQTLSASQKELYEKIREKNAHMHEVSELAGFRTGFSLAVDLLMTAMHNELPENEE